MKKDNVNISILYKVIPAVFTVILLGAIYMVNNAIPFSMDDDWYATMLFSDEAVTSLAGVIEAQIWHYQNWGGRSMAHGLLQLVLMQGELFADLLNVLAMSLLSWLICLQGKSKSMLSFSIVLAMLVSFSSNWRESLFWQSGAANYLYMMIFIVFFIACYFKAWNQADFKWHGISVWILPLGLIVGWSNENMGPAVFVMVVLVMLYMKKEGKRIPPWMISGSVMNLIGSAFLILAPGNFIRTDEVSTTTSDMSLLWKMYVRCYTEAVAALNYMFPIVLLSLVMICIYCGVCEKKLKKEQIVLGIGAVLSWGAMILSPHYPERATFGTSTLLICLVASLGKSIWDEKPSVKIWIAFTGVLIWLRAMFVLVEYVSIIWGWV